jgi:hypothetical protein
MKRYTEGPNLRGKLTPGRKLSCARMPRPRASRLLMLCITHRGPAACTPRRARCGQHAIGALGGIGAQPGACSSAGPGSQPGQNKPMKPQSPESLRTGSSKVATVRRRTPRTLKKSFQKDWRSAASRVSPCHSRLKAVARWRISFHDSGMGGGYHVS